MREGVTLISEKRKRKFAPGGRRARDRVEMPREISIPAHAISVIATTINGRGRQQIAPLIRPTGNASCRRNHSTHGAR
jgi:hypothetical protein